MRLLLLTLALVALSGCVTSSVVPSHSEITKAQSIYVVPMEPPPLAAPAHFGLSIAGWARSVPMFAPASGSQRDDGISSLIQASIEKNDAWLPTRVLAGEIRSQLLARGLRTEVSPTLKRVTGLKDRRITLFMENWLAPLRDWYNRSDPEFDYQKRGLDPSSYVIEVGILNYELTGQHLLLQVMVKLIEPSSGKLIGRARAASRVPLPDYERLFANDGAEYKAIFATTGKELVRQCLFELGLVS